MKLKIIDVPLHYDYVIDGEEINGINVAEFPPEAIFRGDDSTEQAGIFDVERRDGELYVTLGQHGLEYECQPVNDSHDWFGVDKWIDADDFNPQHCYIVATAAPADSSYVQRDEGWTVTCPVVEELDELSEEQEPEPLSAPEPASPPDPGQQLEPAPSIVTLTQEPEV